jgi:aryl-alcohol dehydrogenase-like predicted oxidoreductase
MGMSQSCGPPPGDRQDMIDLIHAAVDRGVTFFDTAEGDGPWTNEELVGQALASSRGQVVIATKLHLRFAETGRPLGQISRPERVPAAEGCLCRLGVEHIDLYSLHRVNPKVPIEDIAGAVADVVAAGKLQHLRMLEAAAGTIRRAHAVQPVTAIQNEYSLWHRRPEANHALVDLIAKVAERKCATPGRIVPLPGTRRLERLEENIDAAAVELTPDDLRDVESATATITVQEARYPEEVERWTNR